MREFAVVGDPVEHSLSPRIHEAAFEHWGADASYVRCRAGAEELDATLRRYAGRGGGNVTLPHKERAAELLDVATEEVRATGACNCFWGTDDGSLAGDNTDVGGFIEAVAELGVQLNGARVLVLGAGGAARAVVHALRRLYAGRIDIWNRTAGRARAIAAGSPGAVNVVDRLPGEGGYDLVVNTTSLGLDPSDRLPIDLRGGVGFAAFDVVYAPGGTAFSRHAAGMGLPASDGLSMLVHQAALSLRRWFPDREPPLQPMFEAARAGAR